MTLRQRLWTALFAMAIAANAQATTLRLEAASPTVTVGNAFLVNIVADIDAPDAIIGFGFDLGAAGFRYRGFTPGAGFADDPVYLAPYSDADGIRGASAGSLLFGSAVSGLDILLGVLQLEALGPGTLMVGLTADDLFFNFTEGLIPGDPNLGNFMPTVDPLALLAVGSQNAVDEPDTLACIALALAWVGGLAARRRKVVAQTVSTTPW